MSNTLQQQVQRAIAQQGGRGLAVGQRYTPEQAGQMFGAMLAQMSPDQQKIAVGACGNPFTTMRPGVAPSNPSLPNFGPNIPDSMVVRSNQTLLQDYSTLGVRVQAAAAAGSILTALVSPNYGWFSLHGFKTFNDAGEINITAVSQSNSSVSRIAGTTDAATWNTVECFCPIDWGCSSPQAPLRLSYTGIVVGTTPPFLEGTFWGLKGENMNSCDAAAVPGSYPGPAR